MFNKEERSTFPYWFAHWCLFYFEPTESSYAFHSKWTWLECKIVLFILKRIGYTNAFMISEKEAKERYKYIFEK